MSKPCPTIEEHRNLELFELTANPLFLTTDRAPEGYDGEHRVAGKLKTKVTGALLAPDGDVFFKLVDKAARARFRGLRVSFVARDLLRELGWGDEDADYERLRSSIQRLYEVSVYVAGVTVTEREGVAERREVEDGRFGTMFRLIQRINWDTKAKKEDRYWVEFSEAVKEVYEAGGLRLVSQVRYRMSSPIARRLVDLIACKLPKNQDSWRVSVFALAELLPLWGKSYKYQSTIKQKLARPLKELEAAHIIERFEFPQEDNRFLVISPNLAYFGPWRERSEPVPAVSEGTAETPAASSSPALPVSPVEELVKRGVGRRVAVKLAAERPAIVSRQIEHYDAMKAARKAAGVGWLLKAIEQDFALPEGFKTKEVLAQDTDARRQKARSQKLYEEATLALSHASMAREPNERRRLLNEALEKGTAGGGMLALEIAEKARQALALEDFENGLGREELAALEATTLEEIRADRELKIIWDQPPEVLRENPLFQAKRSEAVRKLAEKMTMR